MTASSTPKRPERAAQGDFFHWPHTGILSPYRLAIHDYQQLDLGVGIAYRAELLHVGYRQTRVFEWRVLAARDRQGRLRAPVDATGTDASRADRGGHNDPVLRQGGLDRIELSIGSRAERLVGCGGLRRP